VVDRLSGFLEAATAATQADLDVKNEMAAWYAP